MPFSDSERFKLESTRSEVPFELQTEIRELENLPKWNDLVGLPSLQPVFSQTILPSLMNSGGHVDHGHLVNLAHDAALLSQGNGANFAPAAALKPAPILRGWINYVAPGSVGDEVHCLSDGHGRAILEVRPVDASSTEPRVLCHAFWQWGEEAVTTRTTPPEI
jgi:hypothetical protein